MSYLYLDISTAVQTHLLVALSEKDWVSWRYATVRWISAYDDGVTYLQLNNNADVYLCWRHHTSVMEANCDDNGLVECIIHAPIVILKTGEVQFYNNYNTQLRCYVGV